VADAWYLPGHPDLGPGWREGTAASGVIVRAPALTRAEAETVAERVRHAALAARYGRSIADVVGAIDRVATRLGGDSLAEETAISCLAENLGWPRDLARETLTESRRGWSRSALDRLLHTELGDPAVLDRFVADAPSGDESIHDCATTEHPAGPLDGRRYRRAAGPPLLLQVLAANVPGVAVTAIIRGLLVRSGVLCKASRAEPGLPALFARLLAEEDRLLGETLAVTWWPPAAEPWEWRVWRERANMALVYGGSEAVEGIRNALPARTPLLAYGPRVGIAVVLNPAGSDPATARALASDVCAYEQRGCVSPRFVFVVGADADEFAGLLAAELEAETLRQPPPVLNQKEALAIRSLRAEVELGSTAGRLVASEPDLRWTILVDREPRIDAPALPRLLRLCSVASVGDLLTALEPLSGHIQAIGYAGNSGVAELAEAAVRLGACRVAPVGRIAWPPVDWRHDGRHQLVPLLRWTEWET
jgi:hypothetical protein